MKNKKIVLIENSGSDFYNSRLRYALHLKSLGNLVYAIIPDDGYFDQINSSGINVILVSNNIRGSGILNKIIYGIDLIRIFKNIKFDIVHTFRLQPNIIGTLVAGTITKSKIVNHII